MNTTFRESKVRKYMVKAVDVYVTEYNDAYDDWSGESFAKAPFVVGETMVYGDITLEDVARLILKELYVYDYDTTLSDIVERMDVYENTIRLTVCEDEGGYASISGRYLADYTFAIKEVVDVDTEKLKVR